MKWSEIEAAAKAYKDGRDYIREGQAIMYAIYSTHPPLYDQIVATNLDCFYRDDKIDQLKQFIEEKR